MINHARTLLINRVDNVPIGFQGHEFIPPEFAVLPEAEEVKRLRNTLFGQRADRLTVNYRAAQYIELIDADPALSPFLTVQDSRITYKPNYWFDFDFETNIDILDGADASLSVIKEATGNDILGVNQFQYNIRLTGGVSTTDITVEEFSPIADLDVRTVATGNVLDFTLSSGAIMRLTSDDMATASGEWQLNTLVRPSRTLVSIQQTVLAGGGTNWNWPLRLIEPFRTFHIGATRGETAMRKLANSVLLLIYRNNEAFNGRVI